jgi:hypothetical protein
LGPASGRQKNKSQTEVSVGLIASNLTFEGPVYKDKVSFILSGRRTYIDKVFSLAKVSIPYYFYDVNAKLNWTITKRDKLFFSSYLGNDVLSLDNDNATTDSETNIGSNHKSIEFLILGYVIERRELGAFIFKFWKAILFIVGICGVILFFQFKPTKNQ